MRSLRAALRARARRTPDATALVCGDREISFAALEARAASVASGLRSRGVEPGDRVAVLLPNGVAFVEVLHGAIACGAVVVPINTRLAAPEVAHQLADAEPRMLIHGGGELATLARVASPAALQRLQVDAECSFPPLAADASTAPAPTGDPIVALLYTSGTTGESKGVLLSDANLCASAAASQRHLDVRAGDRWLACLPLFHVGGLALLTRSVIDGSCVVLHERFDAARVNAAIDSGAIAFVSLVPTALARLLRERGERPAVDSLRAILLGGAAAPAALVAHAQRLGLPIATTYGLTEAASQVATRKADASGAGLTPLPGTRVRIEDAHGRACPAGVAGEVLVAGPSVMRGYWRRPDATARALAGGWLHTGDIGALDAKRRLHIFARRSDLIVSGGENVYPAEVEAVLATHPDVEDVAVAGIPDVEFGARPAAWIVAARASAPVVLRDFCRARLAGFKVPVAFHFVAELPRNASGKVLRDRLAAP